MYACDFFRISLTVGHTLTFFFHFSQILNNLPNELIFHGINPGSSENYNVPSQNLYLCPYCDHNAPSRSHLNIHMRRHTGEKPYSCRYCPYRSSKLCNIKRHLSHHDNTWGKFKCPYCSYSLNNGSGFSLHLKLHANLDHE